MKKNPIPPDKKRWGRFDSLAEYNLYVLRDILEKAQAPGRHSAIEQKVGDYYAACMDEATIEKKGAAPLQPDLERIAAIKSTNGLIPQVAHMHGQGIETLFSFYSMPDMHDSNLTIANLDQGGITLPDRDYYIKDDAKSIETRQRYQQHVRKMFELFGDKPQLAALEANTVLAVKIVLAKAAMDRPILAKFLPIVQGVTVVAQNRRTVQQAASPRPEHRQATELALEEQSTRWFCPARRQTRRESGASKIMLTLVLVSGIKSRRTSDGARESYCPMSW